MAVDKEINDLIKFGADQRGRKINLELLQAKFIADCTFSYAGGTFLLTPEFINYVRVGMMNEDYHWGDNDILIDMNMRPTLVHPMSEFYNQIRSVYKKAVNDYYLEYEKWRTARNITQLVDK